VGLAKNRFVKSKQKVF